jgi:hypothetical protein
VEENQKWVGMGRERRDDLKLPEEENGNKFYKLV